MKKGIRNLPDRTRSLLISLVNITIMKIIFSGSKRTNCSDRGHNIFVAHRETNSSYSTKIILIIIIVIIIIIISVIKTIKT